MGSKNSFLRYDLENSTEEPFRIFQNMEFNFFKLSKDNLRLFTICFLQKVLLWDLEDQSKPPTYLKYTHKVIDKLIFNHKEDILLTFGEDNSIFMQNLNNLELSPIKLEGHTSPVVQCIFNWEDTIIYSCDKSGVILVWYLINSNVIVNKIEICGSFQINKFLVTKAEDHLFFCSQVNNIQRWSLPYRSLCLNTQVYLYLDHLFRTFHH